MIPQTPDIMQSPLCYEGDTRTIPADTPLGTNQLSYKQGFPPITGIDVDAGGIAPEREDFNAALKLLSIHTYFLQSGNQYKYSNLLDYELGSIVLGSDNALYYCIQANGATSPNTVQDPTTSTGYWVKVIDSQGILNINVIGDGTITNEKIANGAVNDAKISGVAASKVTGLLSVAAPLPVKGSGTQLGVWKRVLFANSESTNTYTLPKGGTWAWFCIRNTRGVAFVDLLGNVDAGGTVISAIAGNTIGIIYRIA